MFLELAELPSVGRDGRLFARLYTLRRFGVFDLDDGAPSVPAQSLLGSCYIYVLRPPDRGVQSADGGDRGSCQSKRVHWMPLYGADH